MAELVYVFGGGQEAVYKDGKLWAVNPGVKFLLEELRFPYALTQHRLPFAAWASMGETFPDTVHELEGYL